MTEWVELPKSNVIDYQGLNVLLPCQLARLAFLYKTHFSIAQKKLPAHCAGKTQNSVSEEQGGDNQYTYATRSAVLRSVARKSLPCSVGGTQP